MRYDGIASKNTTSKKISGLKAGTKYYVQVRAYKTVDGKKYYSDWSAKKSVKTKAKAKKTSSGTVYITDTGEKYHRGTCRYLRYSKYAISKSDAISQGYTACKVCRPSQCAVGQPGTPCTHRSSMHGPNYAVNAVTEKGQLARF